jgi:hypothetical protein
MRARVEFHRQGFWLGVQWASYAPPPTMDGRRVHDLWLSLVPMLPLHLTWGMA